MKENIIHVKEKIFQAREKVIHVKENFHGVNNLLVFEDLIL